MPYRHEYTTTETGKDAHSEALDAVFAMRRECMDAVHEVRSIARALVRVGMTQLSDELYEISLRVDETSRAASEAYAGSVSQRATDTEQSTKRMVEAFVSGIGARS